MRDVNTCLSVCVLHRHPEQCGQRLGHGEDLAQLVGGHTLGHDGGGGRAATPTGQQQIFLVSATNKFKF